MEYCWFVIMFMFSTFVPQTYSQANQYAIMQFVLQWNPTFCMTNQCVNPIPQNFTIHGMWPADVNGYSLAFPLAPMDIVIRDINAILMTKTYLVYNLAYVWPSVVPAVSNKDFWSREWAKHGYGIRNKIDLLTYFQEACRIHGTMIAKNGNKNLKDYFLNNPSSKLQDTDNANIQLGQMITLEDIDNALAPIVRGVDIHCLFDGEKNYLKAVIFCLDKSSLNQFVSCPRTTPPTGAAGAVLSYGCVPQAKLYLPA